MSNLKSPFIILTVLTGCTLILLHPKLSFAKDSGPLLDIYTCAKISEDAKRLACFDEKIAVLKVKDDKKEFVAIDAEAVQELKRESFGFSLPSLPKLALPSLSKDKRENLEVKITKMVKRNRRYIFTMENGQVWEQTSGDIRYIPKGDLIATIKPKSMGSFMLSASNGKNKMPSIRVRRIQ